MIDKTLKVFSAVLLIIFLFFFFYLPIETEDIWWHLSVGRWMHAHHQFPRQDIFAYPEYRTSWILNQALGSYFYYGIYSLGGMEGLKIFRALFFTLIIVLFYFHGRRQIPWRWLSALLLLMAFGLGTRSFLRPLIFTLLFLQLFLVILYDHHKGRNKKGIFLIPFLSLIWENLHAGAFMYGMPLVGIFLLSVFVQYLQSKGISSEEREAAAKRLKTLALVFVGQMVASFINPYGIEGALFPWRVLLERKMLFHVVDEMLPPVYILSWQAAWFHLLTIGAIVCIIKNRKQAFADLLVFVFALFLFLYGSRGSELFTIVCVYIILESCRDLNFRTYWENFRPGRWIEKILTVLLILLLTGNILRLVNQKVIYGARPIKNIFLTFDTDNPTPTVELLKRNNIKGRVFNSILYGGYLIWSGYPDLQYFVDSRHANEKLLEDFFKVEAKPQKFWDEVAEKYHIDIVMMKAAGPAYGFIEYLLDRPDWQLISVDGTCVTWVRRGKFALPPELNDYQNNLKEQPVSVVDNAEAALAKNPSVHSLSWLQDFLDPPAYYVDSLEKGAVLFTTRYPRAGLKLIIDTYQATEHPKAYLILKLAVKEFRKLTLP